MPIESLYVVLPQWYVLERSRLMTAEDWSLEEAKIQSDFG
jgi:hypothetical protein